MSATKVLVVDDDDMIRQGLCEVLNIHGFDVTTANSAQEALKLIASSSFDVLLTDLHMPGAGDGLTLVSAMRHLNPKAVTILLSAFPEMRAAARALVAQTDEVLTKTLGFGAVVDVITQRLATGNSTARPIETVATILERSVEDVIARWFDLIEKDEKLMALQLDREERTQHLPKMMNDLVTRLRTYIPLGSKDFGSVAARAHGVVRRRQGYSASMMVEESRMLQVSLFDTLQNNLATIDFSVLLIQVMTIADEVDWQLAQAVESYNQTGPAVAAHV